MCKVSTYGVATEEWLDCRLILFYDCNLFTSFDYAQEGSVWYPFWSPRNFLVSHRYFHKRQICVAAEGRLGSMEFELLLKGSWNVVTSMILAKCMFAKGSVTCVAAAGRLAIPI